VIYEVEKENAMERLRLNFLFIAAGMLCFIIGFSLFTFVRAEGYSYFSDSPDACVNCHVMTEQFTAWGHSSHARVATCNDCHGAHDNIFSKLFVKGLNGFNHSFAFTFNTYEEVITVTDFNQNVANDSCLYCHQQLVSVIAPNHGNAPNCVSCHAGIGHPIRD
jgi:cytochrome c nitrite reductase small subunit